MLSLNIRTLIYQYFTTESQLYQISKLSKRERNTLVNCVGFAPRGLIIHLNQSIANMEIFDYLAKFSNEIIIKANQPNIKERLIYLLAKIND